VRTPAHLARRAALLVAGLLGLAPALATAEDIDIFGSPSGNGGIPNVIIVLDSSANWSSSIPVPNCYYKDNGVTTTEGPKATTPNKEQGTKMAIEKCALYNVVDGLPVGEDGSALVAVGLMLFNESPAAISGGYPRKAIVPVTAANKTVLKDVIKNITIDGDKGNNAAFAKSLYEAFLYLSARAPYRGTSGTKWDGTAVVNGRYVATAGAGCGRDTIIFIANGRPGEVTDNEARALLVAENANVSPITYPTSLVRNSDQSNWADEMARHFRGADISSSIPGVQGVTTHAIAVTGASSDGNYPNFIRGIATAGGGTFREANNVDALVDGITAVFNQVIASNTVFASASLPISVNARGTFKNQIFMGMLRPDAKPRWAGNLKQYRFSYDVTTDSLEIVDSTGKTAISSASGFIDPGAISYWTKSSTFWTNAPSGTPASASDSPDGEIVEKGGAGQVLRTLYATSQDARKLYTCVGCSSEKQLWSDSKASFDADNSEVKQEALGAASSEERKLIIQWVRGADNVAGAEKGPGGTTTVRPSIHGDVLHSRPAVITYGDRVVVFYGGNDGMLHAVEGTQDAETGGKPLWGFVPEEVFGKLKRLRDNFPDIKYPTTPSTLTSARPRDYFVDGNVSVYQKYEGTTLARAIIYFGMRRGGRVVYAIDVTDPDKPKFLWRKSNDQISVLGQTWSEPKVARLKGYSNPVVIMGAGYDPTEDTATPGTPTMGNAVLVLDAISGNLVKTFTTTRPVPADVAFVDTDYDSYVDRAYAVDLGGNVYRLDFEPSSGSGASNWAMTTLASLGDSGGKKFFFPPDVVLLKEYAVVLVGSGDREKPRATTSSDYFYTLLDRNVGKTVSPSFQTIRFADLPDRANFTPEASTVGCRIALDTRGEKVVNAPVSVGGMTYFSTNRPTPPSDSQCTANLGVSKSYAVPLLCGEPDVVDLVGGGLPPSPVTGVVEVQASFKDETGKEVTETRLVPFIIGGHNAKKSAIEGSKVRPPVSPRRTKLYWFFDRDR
jgi:type IV pilus assembly protein PilY1